MNSFKRYFQKCIFKFSESPQNFTIKSNQKPNYKLFSKKSTIISSFLSTIKMSKELYLLGSSLGVQRTKDQALPLLWLRSNPWPGNLHMPWQNNQPTNQKKKQELYFLTAGQTENWYAQWQLPDISPKGSFFIKRNNHWQAFNTTF